MSEEEFEQKVDESLPMTRAAVRNILRHRYANDVDDVLQLAIFKAWLGRNKFRGDSKFSTWFTRIAMNEALMLMRREGSKLKIRSGSFVPLRQIQNERSFRRTPEQRVIDNERCELIFGKIKLLPKLARQELLRFLAADKGDPLNNTNTNRARRHNALVGLKNMVKRKWR